MNKVAVAILNYNGESYLRQFLPNFLSYSENSPIYVIDNKSLDNSIETLKAEFPTVKIVELQENFGYAGGYNEGIKSIEAEYVAIVNSDIEVTENWLNPLTSFLDKNRNCVSVQPKIKSFSQKDHFEYAGAAGGFLDSLGYPYCRGRIFEQIEPDKGQYDQDAEVFWTSGACFLIRREVFLRTGGFDVDFFAHMEEIDLCWRLKRAGWNLFCLPESTVYHVGGGTLSSSNPKKTYLNFRNGLFLLLKNLKKSEFYKLPLRIVLDWIAALKFVLDGNSVHSIAVFRAHIQFVRFARREYSKRSGPYISTNQIQILNLGSLVWKRFVEGKKKFSVIHQ